MKKRNKKRVKRSLKNPFAAKDYASSAIRYGLLRLLDSKPQLRKGVKLLDEDWDTLLVLDACRYDTFNNINTLPGDLEQRNSLGSATPEFIQKNFADRTAHDTIYISANAMVGANIDALDMYKVVGLWSDDGISKESQDNNVHSESLVNPEPVVKTALQIHDKHPNKRLIVHFLQPHTPFLMKDGEPLSPNSPYRTFDAARAGDIDADEIKEVYQENVEYVLEYVEKLVEKLNGKTVITSDHGELLGERIPQYMKLLHPRWSIRERHKFDYAHYNRLKVSELVNVPWLELPYEERRKIISDDDKEDDEIETDTLDNHLEALGYKT